MSGRRVSDSRRVASSLLRILLCPLCPLCRRGIGCGAGAGRAAGRSRRRSSRPRSTSSAISTTPRGRPRRAPVRRTASAQAVPALLQAVAEHADGYVRYRALVLLTGFNDPRTKDAMRESLASPNDRLRTVAYSFFEHNPDRAMVPQFLTALDKEQAEFVRPALGARARGARRRRRAVRQALLREVGARRGLLPQRRDRSARRLQGAVRLRRADRRREARRPAAGRCGAGAREDRRQARARDAGGAAAHGAAADAAVDRGRDLPARRQLRVAREAT